MLGRIETATAVLTPNARASSGVASSGKPNATAPLTNAAARTARAPATRLMPGHHRTPLYRRTGARVYTACAFSWRWRHDDVVGVHARADPGRRLRPPRRAHRRA